MQRLDGALLWICPQDFCLHDLGPVLRAPSGPMPGMFITEHPGHSPNEPRMSELHSELYHLSFMLRSCPSDCLHHLSLIYRIPLLFTGPRGTRTKMAVRRNPPRQAGEGSSSGAPSDSRAPVARPRRHHLRFVEREPVQESEDSEEEVEEVVDFNAMGKPAYRRFRESNPYSRDRERGNELFWTKQQQQIRDSVLMSKKFRLAEHKFVDFGYLRAHQASDGVAEILAAMGLERIMAVRSNFSEELVIQFFASVYFAHDDAQDYGLDVRWSEISGNLG